MDQLGSRNGIRASLACVQCRSRHLRCDGVKPTCSRCKDDGNACAYMKSRRGGRRRAPPPSIPQPEQVPARSTEETSQSGILTPPITIGAIGSHSSLATSQTSSPASHFDLWEDDGHPLCERLIGLFYRFFHSSHPCALPMKFLNPYRASNAPGIDLLISVMQYIGSLYTPKVSSESWREQCEVSIRSLLPQTSLFEVQALVLYSIAAQWNDLRDYADTLLNLAIDRALILGMNDASFATQQAPKHSVFAESCRRTWWQLYAAELSMAAIERKTQTRLNIRAVACSVDLPCSESEYDEGVIPEPRTLEEWDQREFSDEVDDGFSSFSYYIGLYRTFDFCLYGKPRNSEEAVKRICTCADAGVVSFRAFCSKTSRKLMTENGKIDYFILKANLGIVVYTAEIHRFLSTITYNPIEAVSTCGPPPPPEKLAPAFVQEAPIHTTKILQATELLVDLLTLPINLLKQSPFLVCQIATPTVALMAACKSVLQGEEIIAARERIRVSIAAVEKFAEVWPRAARTAKELKLIAREIFGIKKSPSPRNVSTTTPTPQYPEATSAGTFENFAFFDNFMAGTQCDFGTFQFDTGGNVAASGGSISEEASTGSTTIAY